MLPHPQPWEQFTYKLTVFPRPDPFSSVLGTLGSSPYTCLIMAQGCQGKENGSEEQREKTQRRRNTHWATKKDGGDTWGRQNDTWVGRGCWTQSEEGPGRMRNSWWVGGGGRGGGGDDSKSEQEKKG